MKKQRKDKHFIKKPEYPGGVKGVQAFLAKHKKYPEKARLNGVEGTVHLRYTINNKGVVVKVKVIAGIGYGCDEEAKRIVKLLKFDVPPTHKARIQYHKTIHIHFKKPRQKIANINYLPPEQDAKKTKKKNASEGSYHYQIKW